MTINSTTANTASRRTFVKMLAASGLTLGCRAAHAVSEPALITRTIPSTGEQLPIVGLGTWQTFDVESDALGPIREVYARFLDRGGRVIDTSPMYGRAEGVIGTLRGGCPDDRRAFLATKVWTSGAEAGVSQMNTSFERLRAKQIDLMQVHNLVDVDRHLPTLRSWKAEGRIRYIGVTHYQSGAFERLAAAIRQPGVDFVQLNYSIGDREAEAELLPMAADRGVAVIVNQPFGGGTLFGRVRSTPLPGWATEIGCRSWAQVFLRYIFGHPAVTCAIPATSKLRHLDDNLEAGVGVLPDSAMRRRMASEFDRLL